MIRQPTRIACRLGLCYLEMGFLTQGNTIMRSWSERETELVRTRYGKDGSRKLADRLNRSRASVVMKARQLGVLSKTTNAEPYEWTEEMDQALRELYPTSDRQTLVSRFALPNHAIRTRARRLGLVNLTRSQNAARTKSTNNTSCNYRFFDSWSVDMAYVLGFLFADGSINKRETDVIAAVVEKDVSMLDYIKRVTDCHRNYYCRQASIDSSGHIHQRSVMLILSSKLLVVRLKELGLMPRKTYRDDDMPQMPDEMVPHFIRGYFDGDGSAYVTCQGYAMVSLIGTPKLVTAMRDVLVRLAGMNSNNVRVTNSSTATWSKVIWGARECIRKFRDFVYPTDCPFFLARKREVLDKWLASKPMGDNK